MAIPWSKLGGLDVRDQSRSRTSIASSLTFENGRDYPSRRDQLFFFSVEISKIETFQSRLCRVKIFVEIVETQSRCSRDLSRNLDEKIQKSMHFSIEIETNCRETPKFSDLDEFLDLDRDFLVWTLM